MHFTSLCSCWQEASESHSFSLSTWLLQCPHNTESGFLQNKKRERETIKTKATLSFIIYSWKGCTITSITFCESHRPILVQCGRREPQDSVNSRSGESLEAILEAAYNTALIFLLLDLFWNMVCQTVKFPLVWIFLITPSWYNLRCFSVIYVPWSLQAGLLSCPESLLPWYFGYTVLMTWHLHAIAPPHKIPWGLQAASVPWMNLP